jgi:hypothetical protein
MIIGENQIWKKVCDVCGEIMKEIPQTTTWLSDEPELPKLEVEFNHTGVCEKHTFNQTTGEWN